MGASSVSRQLTLLIIAYNRLLRDGIAGLLNEQPDITAIAAP
jgi:hypothetical protein